MTGTRLVSRRALFALPLFVALFTLGHAGTAQAADLSGSWQGYWESCSTGHRGPLRATFCRTDAAHYRVDFAGRFFKVFPFRYSVTLNVVSDNGDSVQLAGSSYLGRLFGTFTYRATASSTSFVANYSSCKDQGRFVLGRCCSSN